MEVGGAFWNRNVSNKNNINSSFFNFGNDNILCLSGRTAIDLAIQDILLIRKATIVYFPSYCCFSMLDPFIKRNINVKYYNVYFDNELKYDININEECDIFFAMNYFGYTSTNMEEYILKFKERGVCIIEDCTQSLLSTKPFSKYSDYVVASLRKWFPVYSGGISSKLNDSFEISKNALIYDKKIFDLSMTAMTKKRIYIDFLRDNINNCSDDFLNKKEILKQDFLSLYNEFNNEIKKNYDNKLIDDKSKEIILNFDIDLLKKRNKNNVKMIYENLKNNKLKFLIKDYNETEDCLLYVPLYVDKKDLIELKKVIYKNEFYCPSHWPIDDNINDLYKSELSLVCDYRYSSYEIKEKLELINNFGADKK